MREELEKIGLELREWARKYKKDYVHMSIVDDTLMAHVCNTDKDYEATNIFID